MIANLSSKIAIITVRLYRSDNKYPTSDDINKMVSFCIEFAKKRGMKFITLEDRASFICKNNNGQTYTVKLSDYYLLKKYNSYYGHKFGFDLENKMNQHIFLEDVKKLRKTKIKDVDWKKIMKHIENPVFENWFISAPPNNPVIKKFVDRRSIDSAIKFKRIYRQIK